MSNNLVFFGFPDECKKFSERRRVFLDRLPHLEDALNTAFTRVQVMSGPEDKLIYLQGRLCGEDFMEVLLLCEHGYGAAAMKLVRSMYEHGVTLRYLFENPNEIAAFMDYHHVAQHKFMIPIVEQFPGALPDATIAKVKEDYERVKNNFMVTVCSTCDKKRVNHTWNKLDFVAMAKKAGVIGQLIVPGYLAPLRHAHSTFAALSERLEIVDDRMGFKVDSQPDLADGALMTAHNVLLDVLDVQDQRFQIEGLKDKIQVCYQDFMDAWKHGERTEEAAATS